MKILISDFPNSGWWPSGIPKYEDNPAMIEGAIPNMNIAKVERDKLINSITMLGHDVVEIQFPIELDKGEIKHDFIFVRDSFISNQNGKAIILRAGQPQRRIENRIIEQYLKNLNMKTVQIPDRNGIRADGGEFYYCKKENILFSGLKRNTISGAKYVAKELDVEKMIILEGEGYHLDTFFSPVLDINGYIVALIVCLEILLKSSIERLYKFANHRNIPILGIPPRDAIGTKKEIGNFAANALPLPGALIRPNKFSDNQINEKLKKLEIKQVITPTSQFQLSGGAVHCLTNEL